MTVRRINIRKCSVITFMTSCLNIAGRRRSSWGIFIRIIEAFISYINMGFNGAGRNQSSEKSWHAFNYLYQTNFLLLARTTIRRLVFYFIPI